MKYVFILFTCLILQTIACTRNADDTNGDCKAVTITDSAPGCGGWGIIVSGVKYPSANIPSEFQQNGIAVCADYELYADARMCACCGGTWANIKTMKRFIR